ncbi:MAG: class I SAM-dependent methyltransferase [Alphaproteobacteria bacterium]|nr:class I SAM-dependent methyltransferase [Alphaproteobacteria bacterium]
MDGTHPVDGASFRDPSGHVFAIGERVLRTVTEIGRADYEFVRDGTLLSQLIAEGLVVSGQELNDLPGDPETQSSCYTLEHPRLPYISYPYEWPFEMLRSAALLHLDIQIRALDHGISLADASAYNVQFLGVDPIFIDYLSFRRYRPGEYWLGHRQFCEQFLNPLLLRSLLGIPHNSWYRGQLEGIPTEALARVLSLRHKLSLRVLMHVAAPARLQSSAKGDRPRAAPRRSFPQSGYRNMLSQLRNWIKRLHPADGRATTWQDYAASNTYAVAEADAKSDFVRAFISKVAPNLAIDLGCNSGEYSEVALDVGARRVIGFDFDQGALDAAYARARTKGLSLTPLYLDAANPSPAQGWCHRERQSFGDRGKADAVVALAFIHHLAIARNIPLDQVIAWIVGLAPNGVIEFVEKSDPTVRQMLALREDIFANYSREAFEAGLRRLAAIVTTQTVSDTGRTLYWFERT